MAGPLGGIGVGGTGQQIPLANTFQPGQSGGGIKSDDSTGRRTADNITQPRGQQAASSQKTESERQDTQRTLNDNARTRGSDSGDSSRAPRGSLVDITI